MLHVYRFITNHPLNRNHKGQAILRFLKWQITSRLNPDPVIYAFTEKAKLVLERGMTGATGNLYCGLHEFNDMAFLLHFLRPGDTFADIGANVGSFTMLASAHVGAKSLTFEPVAATYAKLMRNVAVNQIEDKVTAYNAAMGSKIGEIDFTNTLDTMNHVAEKGDTKIVKVKVVTLDDIVEHHQVPILLKIDVEGFETEVIKGAENTLNQDALKAIIIELPGAGSRYGYDESKIHDKLLSVNFRAYQYDPIKRNLIPVEQFGTYNTLYVRDLDFVNDRLKHADKIKIRHQEI